MSEKLTDRIHGHLHKPVCDDFGYVNDGVALLAEARDRIQELERALLPLADLADQINDGVTDETNLINGYRSIYGRLLAGQARAARSTLKKGN